MNYFTLDEVRRLLQTARAASERDYCMILVGFWHGLRVSEIREVSAADVRGGKLVVRRLKGSDRTVQELVSHADPLLDEATALPRFLAKTGGRPFNVDRTQIWRLMRRHAEAAGLTGMHPHALKHSCAKFLLGAGVPINAVQRRLGHKSLASTGVYLRVSDREADEAIEKVTKNVI